MQLRSGTSTSSVTQCCGRRSEGGFDWLRCDVEGGGGNVIKPSVYQSTFTVYVRAPNMNSYCIVDIQGFYEAETKNFIIKEIAFGSSRKKKGHFVFQPPEDILPDNTSKWYLENYVHGIPWECGHLPYNKNEKIIKDLLRGVFRVYVKGEPKKKFIQNIVGSACAVYELGELGCPNLNTLKQDLLEESRCFYHTVNSHIRCAVQNVQVLEKWIKNTI